MVDKTHLVAHVSEAAAAVIIACCLELCMLACVLGVSDAHMVPDAPRQVCWCLYCYCVLYDFDFSYSRFIPAGFRQNMA